MPGHRWSGAMPGKLKLISDMTKLNFSTEQLKTRLTTKFKDRAFYEAYASINILSKILSYTFNLLSAATGATFVFIFLQSLIPYPALSGAVTGLFLLLLEGLKRTTAGALFLQYFKAANVSFVLIFVCCCLSGVSILFSYQGAKQTITAMTPPPSKVVDERAGAIRGNVAELDKQISEARNTKWKGTTTSRSQKTINELSGQKTLLLQELNRIEARTDQANDQATSVHQTTTTAKSEYFALFTLISELLFLLCICFCNYYDARSYSELCREPMPPPTKDKYKKDTVNPVITSTQQRSALPDMNEPSIQNKTNTARLRALPARNTTTISATREHENGNTHKGDLDAIRAALTRARGNVSTYRKRLKTAKQKGNQRSIETNSRQLERWLLEVDQYQNQKSDIRKISKRNDDILKNA